MDGERRRRERIRFLFYSPNLDAAEGLDTLRAKQASA